MNLRFPQIFTLLMCLATFASVGLSPARSGQVTSSLQFLFSPLSAPVQWSIGERAELAAAAVDPPPIVPPASSDQTELARLETENRALRAFAENLVGQLETLRARQAEVERVGEALRDLVHVISVLGVESGGREALRLGGTSLPIEPGAPVASEAGIVGRISSVGAAGQSSVRLVTDRGFKLVCRFIRPRADNGSVELRLPLEPTLVEGMGNGEMRIDSLKRDDVARAGLRVGDVIVLADDAAQPWPIELHGRRVGVITAVGDNVANPGLAEVRARPEFDLTRLRQVWLILPPQMMPAR